MRDPLKILFNYPTNILPLDRMNSFCRRYSELGKEIEAYNLLSSSEENADWSNPEIPTMLVNLDVMYVVLWQAPQISHLADHDLRV